MPGCDIECRVSNSFLRRVFGIKGCKFPAEMSHQMKCFTCGIYILFIYNEELLSSKRDFRSLSSFCEVAIASKLMTGIILITEIFMETVSDRMFAELLIY